MTGQSKPGHRKSIRCHQTQTLTYSIPFLELITPKKLTIFAIYPVLTLRRPRTRLTVAFSEVVNRLQAYANFNI